MTLCILQYVVVSKWIEYLLYLEVKDRERERRRKSLSIK